MNSRLELLINKISVMHLVKLDAPLATVISCINIHQDQTRNDPLIINVKHQNVLASSNYGLPDQSVHFLGLNVIHLLDCSFDFLLVSTNVNNEHQGIVVLNLFHCRLSSKWVLQNLIVVQLISRSCTDAWILGVSLLFQCPGTVKCNLCPDLLCFLKCWP